MKEENERKEMIKQRKEKVKQMDQVNLEKEIY